MSDIQLRYTANDCEPNDARNSSVVSMSAPALVSVQGSKYNYDDQIYKIICRGTTQQHMDLLRIYPLIPDLDIFKLSTVIYNNTHALLLRKIKKSVLSTNSKYVKIIANIRAFIARGILSGNFILDSSQTRTDMAIMFHDNIEVFKHIQKCAFVPAKITKTDSIFFLDLALTCYDSIDNIKIDDFVNSIDNYYKFLITNFTVHELLLSVKDPGSSVENFKILFDIFNKISNLVTSTILQAHDNKTRLCKLQVFMDMAQEFLERDNYEAFFAIMCGINNNSVQRIKPLWKPDYHHTITYQKLEKMICPLMNYESYRNHVKSRSNIIPYMGIVRSDIEHCLQIDLIDDSNHTINFNCYNMLAHIINTFESSLPEKLCHELYDTNITNFIKKHEIIDEENLHTMSCYIYPTQFGTKSSANLSREYIGYNKLSTRTSPRKLSSRQSKLRQTKSLVRFSFCDDDDAVKKQKVLVIIGNTPKNERRLKQKEYEFIYKSPMVIWSHDQVITWLKFIKFDAYIQAFQKNNINGVMLQSFDSITLGKIGVNQRDIELIDKFVKICPRLNR